MDRESLDSEADWPEIENCLDAAVESLAKAEREAFLLCHVLGQSRRAAAELLEVDEGIIEARAERGLEEVCEILAGQGLNVSKANLALKLQRQVVRVLPPGLLDRVVQAAWVHRTNGRRWLGLPRGRIPLWPGSRSLGGIVVIIMIIMIGVVLGWPWLRKLLKPASERRPAPARSISRAGLQQLATLPLTLNKGFMKNQNLQGSRWGERPREPPGRLRGI